MIKVNNAQQSAGGRYIEVHRIDTRKDAKKPCAKTTRKKKHILAGDIRQYGISVSMPPRVKKAEPTGILRIFIAGVFPLHCFVLKNY